MANVRPRRRLAQGFESMHPLVRHYVLTGERDFEQAQNEHVALRVLQLSPCRPAALREFWTANGDELLQERVADHPGTRPWIWWHVIPPNVMVNGVEVRAPRERIGGTGTPKYEVFNFWPAFQFGLPTHWVEEWEVDYYNGRARDVNGNRIGTAYNDGDFTGVPIDPSDPPRYESEAAYLKRHGLLLPGEERRLRPKDFEPESVVGVLRVG